MANWNLSVELRGHGNDLAQSLKAAAKNARSLGAAARTAKTEVRALGEASKTATRHIRALGTTASTTQRHLTRFASAAQSANRQLNRYGNAARDANRHLSSLGGHTRDAARDLASMSRQINSAVRDLTRLAQAAQRADARMRNIGAGGVRGLRRLADETGRTRHQLASLATLLTGGAFAIGGAELLKMGGEYQQAMNAFGATTGATQLQMQRAAATANQLGNDLSLPGATAGDAAEAMVELAKAGFRTDQAISSTRASLVLASAAQVNAADSAKYLGDMMDQFGMGADQAGKAADTLAATANAASGDITDIYYAMKYAGPVAHGLGVNMQETAAAVGMLGKAGILGQTAGTTLRGMFANLAKPTKQMTEGLKTLGISAYDAQGNFKGLRYVIDRLSTAQGKLSQKNFTAAVTKAFGKPAMSGAIALAHQGVDSYDALVGAVSQTGAAADIASAKGKGLAGALLQLKTQAQQTGLTLYTGMAPGLEAMVRGITSGLSKTTPRIKAFFDYVNAAATLFGPGIAATIHQQFASIADAVDDLAGPFRDLGGAALADFLHLLLTVGQLAAQVLTNVAHAVTPVVAALGDLAGQGDSVASSLDIVVAALDLAATAAGALSGVLVPIGQIVGGLVSAFSALPGPIQQFVIAALLVNRIQGRMSGLASTVSGRVTGAWRSLNEQMAVQRGLATAAGQSLSRYGAAMAVLQTRVPVIGRMGTAFRTASAQTTGFTGALRGVTAAAGAGLRGAMSGLMGAMGGPWGLALTGLTVGLGYLASRQQQAAQAAAEHQQQIASLSQALRESKGAVDENVRAIAAENLMGQKIKTTLDGQQRLVDVARQAKIPMSELVDAYTNQGTSLGDLQKRLEAYAKASKTTVMDPESGLSGEAFTKQGRAADDLRKGLSGLSGDFKKAAQDAKSLNEGINGTDGGITAYGRLKDAVTALADKTADADSRTRALKDALDLLSGGSVSLQAAQARVNEAITQANDAMASGVSKADGWGKALIKANGSLDTTSKNGQSLFSTLSGLADASGNAAIAAFDFAQAQGKSMPAALKASQGEMQKARDAAGKLGQGYGLTKKQAQQVADSVGLIPGQVGILLQTKGVDSTLADLLAVKAAFEQTPDAKTVKVNTLSADARKQLEDLGYKIKLIPGTREYKITAKTSDARRQLDALIDTISAAPSEKTVHVTAETLDAIAGLQAVQDKVSKTNGKTITMKAPTAEARAQLEALGFKIRHTNGKTVTISVPTGGQKAAITALQDAINRLRGKTVTITQRTIYESVIRGGGSPQGAKNAAQSLLRADGAVDLYRYAQGGMRERHIAQIAPAGAWRMWAEPETGGEAYIPLAASKRPRSRALAEETVRRLGGNPDSISWFADGGGLDFTYSGTGGSANKYTLSGLISASANSKGDFDLNKFVSKLRAANNSLDAWRKDLATVASRAGQDVADTLAEMGDDGIALTHKMATGTSKYINDMATQLKNLASSAKANLGEYTSQLKDAVADQATFQKNLALLAGQGYGDLASRLATQGDQDAADLAAAAVKDKSKASSANAAAKAANAALSADQVTQLVSIISAISSSKTGIHDVAAKTGLGEDDIITVATKAKAQITSSLGARAGKFLADLGRAQQHLSYADGGLRAGIYATRGGIVRFAEPETHGEAYLPLAPSKRRTALPVLADVAHRFGLGLTNAAATRPVIVQAGGDTTNVNVTAVRTGATASDIGAQVGRSVRRARRGGVAARAA